jgi:pimeloyl-ACP methyl ester carboxylesterase
MHSDRMIEAKFDTGPVTLNYAEGPEAGPPLVLLHGGSARWQYFDDILPELAARWHVFAPDLRGHGRSGRTPGRYAIRDYADDVSAFLQKVSGPASLFGHSLGGMVALMTADQCPDWVNAVVVGDSPLDAKAWQARTGDRQRAQIRSWQALAGGGHSIEAIMAGLKDSPMVVPGQSQPLPLRMRDVFADDDGVYAHLAHRLYHNDPAMIGMLLDDFDQAMAGYDLERLGPSIECPVLLLQADARLGSATTDDEVARALAILPRASHKRFPGLSHRLFIEDKAAVLQAVEEFLIAVERDELNCVYRPPATRKP